MKRYDSYKDSGVEWIGEVPSHWEVLPLKFKSDIIMGQSPDGKDIVPFGKTLFMQGNADFNNYYPTPNMYCDSCSKYSRINDILMSVRAPVGELNFSDKIYGIGRGLCSIKGVDVYQKYLWYYLQMTKDIYKYFETGSTFTAITISVIKNLKLIDPSKEEQHKIAYYLDTKCGEIDKVISTQEKRISLLQELKQSIITHAVTKGLNPDVKMKDSGIEWIGEVPEHWDCAPFKRFMNIKNGQDYKSFQSDDGYPVIGSGGCFAYCTRFIYDGESLLLGRKGTIDKPLYVNGKFWTVDTMFYSIPQKNCSVRYMYYQSLTIPFERYYTSTALPSMTQTDLGLNNFCFPPIPEQQEIASYLDKRCAQIDASICKAQREIELLQEYKQSLITEVVTGKRKVC